LKTYKRREKRVAVATGDPKVRRHFKLVAANVVRSIDFQACLRTTELASFQESRNPQAAAPLEGWHIVVGAEIAADACRGSCEALDAREDLAADVPMVSTKENLNAGQRSRSGTTESVGAHARKIGLDAWVLNAPRGRAAGPAKRGRCQRRAADDQRRRDPFNVDFTVDWSVKYIPHNACCPGDAATFTKRSDVPRSVEDTGRILDSFTKERARSDDPRRAARQHGERRCGAAGACQQWCRFDPIAKNRELCTTGAKVK
jgi:hypothetical protein